jgi:hypothetical protein
MTIEGAVCPSMTGDVKAKDDMRGAGCARAGEDVLH